MPGGLEIIYFFPEKVKYDNVAAKGGNCTVI